MVTIIKNTVFGLLLSAGVLGFAFAGEDAPTRYEIMESMKISDVPAGFPVRFCLLTADDMQYVAYYDAERRMTVASRALDSDQWLYQILPSTIAWDSHNYIAMAMDDDGHLHVSGNMHADPLVYFRTEKPKDITTLKRFSMTGENEQRCTYPKFMRDAEDRLIFHYRDGGSGNGNEIYNVYDPTTKIWSRLLEKPLTDGEGKMNAYMRGPGKGPDGWFHLVWVWRDTPDCATNHHLSHARSKDLIHWESIFGDQVELPLTIGEEKLWVDPVPSGGGMINGGQRWVFDSKNRPVIIYHKADDAGNMQIYAARPEGGKWVIRQLTDWDKQVSFSGNGSMGFVGISIRDASRVDAGLLTVSYSHRDYGSGRLVIDEKTLRPVDKKIQSTIEYPSELGRIQSDFDGMQIQGVEDSGDYGDDAVKYILQWETLGSNKDRPRQPPLPEPSELMLYKLKAED